MNRSDCSKEVNEYRKRVNKQTCIRAIGLKIKNTMFMLYHRKIQHCWKF